MGDYSKQITFFKNRIKNRLSDIEGSIPDNALNSYINMVEACNDYDKIREMADMSMQIGMLQYIYNIDKKLKEANTSLKDINDKNKEENNYHKEKEEISGNVVFIDVPIDELEETGGSEAEALDLFNRLSNMTPDDFKRQNEIYDIHQEIDAIEIEDYSEYDEDWTEVYDEEYEEYEDEIFIEFEDGEEVEVIDVVDFGMEKISCSKNVWGKSVDSEDVPKNVEYQIAREIDDEIEDDIAEIDNIQFETDEEEYGIEYYGEDIDDDDDDIDDIDDIDGIEFDLDEFEDYSDYGYFEVDIDDEDGDFDIDEFDIDSIDANDLFTNEYEGYENIDDDEDYEDDEDDYELEIEEDDDDYDLDEDDYDLDLDDDDDYEFDLDEDDIDLGEYGVYEEDDEDEDFDFEDDDIDLAEYGIYDDDMYGDDTDLGYDDTELGENLEDLDDELDFDIDFSELGMDFNEEDEDQEEVAAGTKVEDKSYKDKQDLKVPTGREKKVTKSNVFIDGTERGEKTQQMFGAIDSLIGGLGKRPRKK